MNAARNTIKNLKEEKSSLKISKTKLESEIKKLEKKVNKKVSVSVKQIQTDSPDEKFELSEPEIDSTSSPTSTPVSRSMISQSTISCSQQQVSSSSGSPTATPSPTCPASCVLPSSSTSIQISESPLTPSMVSHWIPVTITSLQSPGPLPSMVPHCAGLAESSSEASLPADTSPETFELYSAATWAPLLLAVKKLEENMNKICEKQP